MATLEKPKIKKKNKSKILTENQLEEIENFNLPSTSAKQDELISHDCFVSAEFKSLANLKGNEIEKDDNENSQETNINDDVEKDSSHDQLNSTSMLIPVSDVVEKNVNEIMVSPEIQIGSPNPWTHNLELPSAPSLERTSAYEPTVNYPNLDSLRQHEENLQPSAIYKQFPIKRVEIISPSPFTSSQLKELYYCQEIEMVKQFEIEFLTNILQDNFESDPLYEYLKNYSLVRNKLKINLIKLKDIQKNIKSIETEIWKIKNKSISYSGICADNVILKGTAYYLVAEINSVQLNAMYAELNKIQSMVGSSIASNNIDCEVFKLNIEQIVREILSYSSFININENSPVTLHKQIDHQSLHSMNHLRRALSIFFCFVRQPHTDKIFLNDVRTWIQQLVALFLRVATIQDHWFLFFHILRCPSGISNWTTEFIQIPHSETINTNDILHIPEINHCISLLYILLLPIKKRDEFLNAFTQSHKDIAEEVKDELWTLVDSDGEESNTITGECIGLKETDLIKFLNQMPFEIIFGCVINAKKTSNGYQLENDGISENQLLKLIAFNTVLIELFGEGLLTYNTERYKQFAKRLGRLIRHTIQYVSDIHEMFIRNNFSKDPYLCERIIIELNSFIIKSCRYIYKTPNLATWQYFSSLPFDLLDSDTIWQLFYYLNVGFPDNFPVACENFKQLTSCTKFVELYQNAYSDIAAEDLYYLIQTFFEMANERDRIKDCDFIQTVCLHIFKIGFINEPTRDICYKSCRDMLSNLTLTFPELIAILLNHLKEHFHETINIIYLFKSLPLENWKTDLQSFEILSNWLLNYNYEKNENVLARVIISHLNWGFDTDKRLFLPHNIHVRMACLVCESLNKHSSEKIGVSGISESVRQVSNLMNNQTNKEQFTSWCWNMVSILRLHLMDNNVETISKALENPSEYLCFVPELENFKIIFQGLSENCPLAMYISILVSLWGHSIPLICQKGFIQMKLLVNDLRHQIVIRCIQLITPLFLDCPETISKCESFQDILKSILVSDRTYLKMVKNLVLTSLGGPVFEHFHNMIICQITNYVQYGLTTPTPFISLWLEILTSIQNWQTMNVVLLIDSVIKIAYQFPESWYSSKAFFQIYFMRCNDWKSDRPSSLKLFLGSSNQNRNFPTLSTDCGWLTLLLLELEHDTQECQTRIWPEFLRQLLNNRDNSNMDVVLKKSCSIVACHTFPSSSLVLYKFANIIANGDINHPLFPILNQKFFSLYLARVYFSEDDERFQSVFGVADKMYEQNVSLMKKVKTKLKQAEELYMKTAADEVANVELSYFYTNCAKIMKTFLLWLEETDINKLSKNQNIELPPQYNVEKLKHIFIRNDQHWTEFLYLPLVRKEQKESAKNWLSSCFRLNTIKGRCGESLPSKPKTTPIQRIKKHLDSYDKPLPPPKFLKKSTICEPLKAIEIDSKILKLLRVELKSMQQFTQNLDSIINEIKSLNSNFIDKMQVLYKNTTYRNSYSLSCSKGKVVCKGTVKVLVQLQRPEKLETVQRNLDNNREKFTKNINEIIEQNVNEFVLSKIKMHNISKNLKTCEMELQDRKLDTSKVVDVAVQFFYDILNNIKDNNQHQQFYTSIAQTLGVFIQNNQETQGIKILEISLKRPELINLLSELFVPSRTEAKYFLAMYKLLIDSYIRRCKTKILVVLMKKFEITNWLQGARPKFLEINSLLKMILLGLENWNNQPETNILQNIICQHLVAIFYHEFPEHYGEVLQMVLNAISEQKISSSVLLKLLNCLLLQCGCEPLIGKLSITTIKNEVCKFATQQNLFNFKSITETITLFAKHFRNERLKYAVQGLYPKHKNYCNHLSIWFSFLSHTAVVTAICAYPGALANQISDWIFGSIIDLYSPWLVVYNQADLQSSADNWMQQQSADNKVFYPWQELYIESATILLSTFVENLQYVLESLPVSDSILGHIFSWYHYHFASTDVGNHISKPIHKFLGILPWNRFCPQVKHIESFFKILHESLPECHSFIGFIFLNIDWSKWLREDFQNFNLTTQNHVISLLYRIFVEISFESNLQKNSKTSEILKIGCEEFPFHLIEFKSIEQTFNWLLLRGEPTIVLKVPSESNSVDLFVLRFLQISCGMMPEITLQNSITQLIAKQMLYIRSIVRMLRVCSTKHNKLLETQEGLQSYRNTIVELLNTIDQKIIENNSSTNKETDAQIMILEIIGTIENQNDFSAKLFVEAIISWQSNLNLVSPVLLATLNTIGLCKKFISCMYLLLESTIFNYFRVADHLPSWNLIFNKLGPTLDKLNLKFLFSANNLLTLHAFFLNKIQSLGSLGEKITFLQDIIQLLENIKTDKHSESKIVIIWGAIISCGCEILLKNDNAKKPLLMLARNLQVISKQSDGWGESILGAIGIKFNKDLNRQKMITRCLCCTILILFPDRSSSTHRTSQEFCLALDELINESNNKTYNDMKFQISKSIEIIEKNKLAQMDQIINIIFEIIQLFYDDFFMKTVNDVWHIEKSL